MELHEIAKGQKIYVQFVWGENIVEYQSSMIDKAGEGIYIEPYLHNGHPLEMAVTIGCGVVCHIFTDDVTTRSRVSWRSVEMATDNVMGEKVYRVWTSGFNMLSQSDERRHHERIQIHQMGKLEDSKGNVTQVRVHDVSDNGISFYAAPSFEPGGGILTISFSDCVRSEQFNLKVKCKVVHTNKKSGTAFFGCEIREVEREYLLYGCLKRVMSSKNK